MEIDCEASGESNVSLLSQTDNESIKILSY